MGEGRTVYALWNDGSYRRWVSGTTWVDITPPFERVKSFSKPYVEGGDETVLFNGMCVYELTEENKTKRIISQLRHKKFKNDEWEVFKPKKWNGTSWEETVPVVLG